MPRSREESENLIAEMLEDFAELSGEDLGDILAEGLDLESGNYEVFHIYEEPEEGEELDLDSDEGLTEDYFDEVFDDLDIDANAEEDIYGDE